MQIERALTWLCFIAAGLGAIYVAVGVIYLLYLILFGKNIPFLEKYLFFLKNKETPQPEIPDINQLPDETVIKRSKLKIILYLLCGIIMTCASVWIFRAVDIDIVYVLNLIPFSIVGSVIGAFVGVATVSIIIPLLSNKTTLIINEKGIIDVDGRFISWECVEEISLESVLEHSALIIIKMDALKAEELLKEPEIIKNIEKLVGFYPGFCGTCMNVEGMQKKPTEVLSIMQAYLSAYRARQSST